MIEFRKISLKSAFSSHLRSISLYSTLIFLSNSKSHQIWSQSYLLMSLKEIILFQKKLDLLINGVKTKFAILTFVSNDFSLAGSRVLNFQTKIKRNKRGLFGK